MYNGYLSDPKSESGTPHDLRLAQHVHSGLRFGPVMGAGATGTVYAAIWKGVRVAVKIYRHNALESSSYARMNNEIEVARKAIHPNLNAVYLAYTLPLTEGEVRCQIGLEKFHLKTYLIMERADCGTLEDHLQELSNLRKDNKIQGLTAMIHCLLDVICGLEYLHDIGVTHGHLKPANILCLSSVHDTRGFRCQLCDYGLASTLGEVTELYSADQGTPMYTSPERLGGEVICPANDIYAFAMLAWQLLDDDDDQAYMPHLQLVHQVLENEWRPEIDSDIPTKYKSMLQRAWATDPLQRPSSSNIRASLTAMLIGFRQAHTGDIQGTV